MALSAQWFQQLRPSAIRHVQSDNKTKSRPHGACSAHRRRLPASSGVKLFLRVARDTTHGRSHQPRNLRSFIRHKYYSLVQYVACPALIFHSITALAYTDRPLQHAAPMVLLLMASRHAEHHLASFCAMVRQLVHHLTFQRRHRLYPRRVTPAAFAPHVFRHQWKQHPRGSDVGFTGGPSWVI